MVDFLEVWHHLQISLQREKIICTPPKKNLSANDNVKVKVPVCIPGCAPGVVGVMGMVGVVGVVGVTGPELSPSCWGAGGGLIFFFL